MAPEYTEYVCSNCRTSWVIRSTEKPICPNEFCTSNKPNGVKKDMDTPVCKPDPEWDKAMTDNLNAKTEAFKALAEAIKAITEIIIKAAPKLLK